MEHLAEEEWVLQSVKENIKPAEIKGREVDDEPFSSR
jgi:hypothetical protein